MINKQNIKKQNIETNLRSFFLKCKEETTEFSKSYFEWIKSTIWQQSFTKSLALNFFFSNFVFIFLLLFNDDIFSYKNTSAIEASSFNKNVLNLSIVRFIDNIFSTIKYLTFGLKDIKVENRGNIVLNLTNKFSFFGPTYPFWLLSKFGLIDHIEKKCFYLTKNYSNDNIQNYFIFSAIFIILFLLFCFFNLWFNIFTGFWFILLVHISKKIINYFLEKKNKEKMDKTTLLPKKSNNIISQLNNKKFILSEANIGIILHILTQNNKIFNDNKIKRIAKVKNYDDIIMFLIKFLSTLLVSCVFIRFITDIIFILKDQTINLCFWLFNTYKNKRGHDIMFIFEKSILILLEENKILFMILSTLKIIVSLVWILWFQHWFTFCTLIGPNIKEPIFLGQIWLVFIMNIQMTKILYNYFIEMKYKFKFVKKTFFNDFKQKYIS